MELHRKNTTIKKRMTQWHVKPEVSKGEVIARSKTKGYNTQTIVDKLKSGAKGIGKGIVAGIESGHKIATSKTTRVTTKKVLAFFQNYNNPRRR